MKSTPINLEQASQPLLLLNPETGLVEQANAHACDYYGLSMAQLVHQSFEGLGQIDLLTQLPNRKLFLDRLHQAILEAQRNHQVMAVLFIDLDRFKPVNDTLGHHAGDQVLIQVAERLQGELREQDTLARLGGDEFVVLLKNIHSIQGVERVATQLLKQLIEPFVLEEAIADLGGSIGVSLYPQDAKTAASLLQKSDLAMYRSKKNGRNQWSFFKAEMDVEAQQRFQLEQWIRQGLDKDLFGMTFSPIIDIRSQGLYALESELTWEGPSSQFSLEVDDLLAVANQSYLGVELGQWQIEQNLQILSSLTGFDQPISLLVALNPVLFRQKNLLEWLDQQLSHHHVEPERLRLLLSPECLNVDMLDVPQRVQSLIELGLEVVVDQFGSQGASLFQIAALDLSAIKMMDVSLSDNLSRQGRKNDRLTSAMMAFAAQLNSNVIASGILETEQLNFMKAHQCYLAQGAFFGPKIPQCELEDYLLHQSQNAVNLEAEFEVDDYD